ncbi:hypothetical protein [Hydrogenophaga sp.]|jgi:hypothetical protein|uniref:hypothetical protein n=1 Tax=Hydrogenophaga sp. TaxID=1904254 RepID=UPI003F6EB278
MDILTFTVVTFAVIVFLNTKDQKRRIALLGQHLGHYRIEALMEELAQGYLRALGEEDPQRREQIWSLLAASENAIADQFKRFASEFSRVDEPAARVSRIALPWAAQVFPNAAFDLREAFRIHAQGIADAVANEAQRAPRDKAFTLSAEMFLMQHTCHWFCRSRTVASARLLKRHQVSHAQVLAAVSPATRRAYTELTGI